RLVERRVRAIVARSEQNPQTDAGSGAGLDVAHLVAHDRGGREIKSEVGGRLQDHSRIGLAPRMIAAVCADAALGVVGAMINAGDRRLLGREAVAHPPGQARIGRFVVIAAADAGLVGDHHQRAGDLVGPEAGELENTGNELELLRSMDVTVVGVDHAVAVEKKGADSHADAARSADSWRVSSRPYPAPAPQPKPEAGRAAAAPM